MRRTHHTTAFGLAGVLGFLAALGCLPAQANQIGNGQPNYILDEGWVGIPIKLTNDDNGAIYNSYDLYLFGSLGEALWQLPHNQARYASQAAMLGAWQLNIEGTPIGEVSMGWYATPGTYNPVAINNIDGYVNVDYAGWYSTSENANQDMMALRLSIPNVQLDGDGDGYATNDLQDYRIELAAQPTTNMGVGKAGVFYYYATGYGYEVAANGHRIVPASGPHGWVEPGAEFWVARSATAEVVAHAEQPGYRVRSVEVDGAVAYTNAAGDNAAISVPVTVGPATGTLAVAAYFEPQTHAVAVESTHAWFGTDAVGNPTGAGTYPYGSSVTVGVDRIVVDPGNPGRRLRFTGVTVE